jgi:class 3 adenylate cyclase/tetratricopeptide (TPR) repeat protein
MADLCGYTGLNEVCDPEEVAEVMDRIELEASRIVQEHDGTVNQFVGDEIVALFGVPAAHEDDAQRAVSSALELHRFVRRLGDELGSRLPNVLRLHTGVHSGLILAKLHDPRHGLYNLRGDTINVAARLRSIAPPDYIVMSQSTQQSVAPFYSSERLESFVLRGRAEPVVAYRILAPTSATTAFEAAQQDGLARLAGRTHELEALAEAFRGVRDGRGRFVTVSGHAGVGKSRLLYEFRRRVEANANVFSNRCEAFGKIMPYQAFLRPVRQALGLLETRPEPAESVLEAGVRALGLEAHLGAYASMLGLGPADASSARGEELRARILGALVDLFIAVAKKGPVLLLLEDWHSADEGSSTAAAYLAQSIADHPILLAISHRPSEAIVWPTPPSRTIELRPLGRPETAQLSESLLGVGLPAWLVDAIHEHTAGNALFVEQVCRALVDAQWNWREPDLDPGSKRRARLPMPDTVQAVLRARIDSLRTADAETLRFASVLGPEFSLDRLKLLLARVDGGELDLAACMRRLVAADLVQPEDDRGPNVYRFKHAITQEVAYETLLRQRRRELHARAARAIERIEATVFDEHCETLAYHYGLGEEFERAAVFSEQAGDRAARTFSLEEARQQYRQAVTCLDRLEPTPDRSRRRVDVGLKWAAACMFKPAVEQLEVLRVSLAHAQRIGYKRGVAYTLCWFGCIEYALGDQENAVAAFTECAALASELGDERLAAQLEVNLGQSYAAAADYKLALDHLAAGLERKERVPSGSRREPRGSPSGFGRAYGMGYLGLVYGDRGEFDLAYSHIQQALSIVRQAKSRALEGSILTQLGMVQLWQGDWAACRRTAALMQGTAEQVHGPYILAMSKTVSGYAMFAAGEKEQGLELLRAAAAWLESTQIGLTLSWNLSCLAEALALCARADDARKYARRALDRAEARDLLGEVAAHRALGLAEVNGQGSWAVAEEHFRRALGAAERKVSEREAAITRLRGAAVALRFGEVDRATTWLDAATQQFTSMKMDTFLAEARALARGVATPTLHA